MSARSLTPIPGAPHGTSGGYSNWKCGCQPCKDAFAAWHKERRQRRRKELAADPSVAEHGTESTYTNWGCRCSECRAGHAAYQRAAPAGKARERWSS